MKIRDAIAAAAAKLEQAHLLRRLGQTDEWRAMKKSLLGVITLRTKRLCEDECGEPETRTIRAELRAFGWFLRSAELTEDAIAAMRKELEGLQSRLARLQDVGLETSDPESETDRQRLAQLLHRTETL